LGTGSEWHINCLSLGPMLEAPGGWRNWPVLAAKIRNLPYLVVKGSPGQDPGFYSLYLIAGGIQGTVPYTRIPINPAFPHFPYGWATEHYPEQ
jgi:hypothetical protein